MAAKKKKKTLKDVKRLRTEGGKGGKSDVFGPGWRKRAR